MVKALEIHDLSKKYGDAFALDGLSFEGKQGECLGLLGSNGAGKSTTMRIITGQLKPTSGSVGVFGFSPDTQIKKVHALVGYIPDAQSLYDELSVFDNIDLFARLYRCPSSATHQVIERLQLGEKSKAKTKTLSKGLRQRVLIARALVHRPKLLLLDEPTSGLDPSSAEDIYRVLLELKKEGSTILLTTHLMNDVDRLCDRVLFLDKGQLIEQGTPSQLKRKYSKNKLEIYYLASEQERVLITTMDDSGLHELYELQQKHKVLRVQTPEAKLEEIFVHLLNRRSL